MQERIKARYPLLAAVRHMDDATAEAMKEYIRLINERDNLGG